jgi:low affinity Fe/Cu permease
VLSVAVVLIWAVTGPFFHFSDTWQLAINTGTTVVTFWMVFVIQSSQNSDTQALQLKLDELIRATDSARNVFLGCEGLPDDAIREFQAEFDELQQRARQKARQAPGARPGVDGTQWLLGLPLGWGDLPPPPPPDRHPNCDGEDGEADDHDQQCDSFHQIEPGQPKERVLEKQLERRARLGRVWDRDWDGDGNLHAAHNVVSRGPSRGRRGQQTRRPRPLSGGRDATRAGPIGFACLSNQQLSPC